MAQLNDMARIFVLELEDLSPRAFFGLSKNLTVFRHDLDMDSCIFENGVPSLI